MEIKSSVVLKAFLRVGVIIGFPLITGAIPFAWALWSRNSDVFKEIKCGWVSYADGACLGVDSSFGSNLITIEVCAIIVGFLIGVVVYKRIRY